MTLNTIVVIQSGKRNDVNAIKLIQFDNWDHANLFAEDFNSKRDPEAKYWEYASLYSMPFTQLESIPGQTEIEFDLGRPEEDEYDY